MSLASTSRRASGTALIVLLGFLSTLGPFSNDSILPNFPFMQAGFGISAVTMQQTLTAYFAPFAVMMLLHGTLSDAFGRRPIIMIGMFAYCLAALVCALAQSFETLLLGRFLQGLSAGAGIVVARAIVRDVFHGEDAQRALALLMIIFGVAPGIAPILGGWLGHLFGWRAVFFGLSIISATLMLLTLFYLPETLPRAQRIPFSMRSLLRGFVGALSSARFVLLLIAFGCNFAGFFIYIVSAPAFGYRILGIEQTEFVWIFGPTIIGMILGAVIARRLAGRLTPVTTVFCGYAFMVGATIFNVVYHLSHPATLPVSVVPIFVYTFGLGIATPSITLLVLDLMPERKGLASSMMGFSQSGSSAILAGVISHLVYDSARSLALCSLSLVTVGVLCWAAFLARLAVGRKEVRA